MRLIALLLALCALSGLALAQDDPAHGAQRAAGMLERAALSLEAAEDAHDRVAALSETVRAYEEGLSALREGVRRAAIREEAIEIVFEAEQDRLGRLLGVLQSMERSPTPLLLLHPSGPMGTARSGMILSDVTPAVAEEAAILHAQLQELAHLRALQQAAENQLITALGEVQQARVALSQAMAERRALPDRFSDETQALETLSQSIETLDGFALALYETPVMQAPEAAQASFLDQMGTLPWPARGRLLRGFGASDAAGIARPGLLIATQPRALVSAPWQASVRYAGPLLDYGNVVVLEPQEGFMIVLGGLGELYVATNTLVSSGDPLGLMGGEAPNREELIVAEAASTGEELTETLYMELRDAAEPVDPTPWFTALGE